RDRRNRQEGPRRLRSRASRGLPRAASTFRCGVPTGRRPRGVQPKPSGQDGARRPSTSPCRAPARIGREPGVEMAKEELIEMEGVVAEVLPDTRFRVTLSNGVEVSAYAAGKMKKHRIRVLPGDRVTMELSPYDLTKGRIRLRHKD